MSNLLIMDQNGGLHQSNGGVITPFTAFNFGFNANANAIYVGQKMAKTQDGNLLVYTNDDSILSSGYRYDPKADTFRQVLYSGNLPNLSASLLFQHHSGLFAFEDTIICFHLNSTNQPVYSYSQDNGWNWTGPYAVANSSPAYALQDIVYFGGSFYVSWHQANAVSLVQSFSLGSPAVTVKTFTSSGGSFALMNNNLFLVVLNATTIQLERLEGGSFVTKYSASVAGQNINGNKDRAFILADTVNEKLYAGAVESTSGTGKWGVRSTDGTGASWAQFDSCLDNISPGTSGHSAIRSLFDKAFTNPIQGIYSTDTNFQHIQWNSSTEKWDVLGTGGSPGTSSILAFKADDAFCGMRAIGLNSGNNRHIFNMRAKHRDGTPIDVTPQFSTDWDDYSNMTLDSGDDVTDLPTVLDDVVIGSETNKFNDKFTADQAAEREGYEPVDADSGISYQISGGVLTFQTTGVSAGYSLMRRFMVSSDFRISLGFSGFAAGLVASNSYRAGLRAWPIGDGGYWRRKPADQLNFVEMAVYKDTVTAQQYRALHTIAGTPNTALAAGESSANPGLWIKRSGTGWTTAYGTGETTLNPGSTLADGGVVMVEVFFQDEGSGSSDSISFDDLHLYSGNLDFDGHKVFQINWNFVADGIVALANAPCLVIAGI